MWTRDDLQRLVRREIGDYYFMVVSNRQPYIHELVEDEIRSSFPAGGLTSALDPMMRGCGGTWLAQGTGSADHLVVDDQNKVKVPTDDPSYTLRMLWLSQQEQQGFYYGFSNEALWPLCHNAYTEPIFDTKDWETYKAVNRYFADQVLDEANGRPAVIFIQDYHFALLPRLIRNADPDIITGQFWHIPWPNPEIFRICPWQSEILEGMLGNDLLGFHINYHCSNFMSTVAATLNARVDNEYNLINYRGDPTLVRPFPISVDFEKIDQEAHTPEVSEEMERMTEELGLGGKVIGLGIDRIDYTKGIPHRFRAVGRFFEKYPEYIGKVTFIQAGVFSRSNIDAYRHLSNQIDQVLDDINQRFASETWQPIIYMPDNLPTTSLMALRRLARFCVVSSLHDGMNLVAKEYVASRFDEDGVLILSPFTGAAQELTDALIINPYATEQFADSIRDAVEMPYEERRSRMAIMRATVRENNIYRWAARLIVELMQGTRRTRRPIKEAVR